MPYLKVNKKRIIYYFFIVLPGKKKIKNGLRYFPVA